MKGSKKMLSVRLDEDIIEILKTKSDVTTNESQADIIESALMEKFAGKNTESLEAQLKTKSEELKKVLILFDELSRKTKVKIPLEKRITVKVTREEHEIIRKKGFEGKISMGTVIRHQVFPNSSLSTMPALSIE